MIRLMAIARIQGTKDITWKFLTKLLITILVPLV